MSAQTCSSCQSPAGWSCSACGPRCAQHVLRRRERLVRFSCVACRKEAALLRVRRSDRHVFKDRLKPALVATLLGRPVLAIGLVALLFSTAYWLDAFGLLLGLAALAVLAVRYASATADGAAFQWPDVTEPGDELVRPLSRVAATAAPFLVLVFLGVYVAIIAPWRADSLRLQSLASALLTGPTFWLSMLPTLLLLPMVMLGATLAEKPWDGLEPRRALKVLKRWPREYGWLLAVVGAGFVAGVFFLWRFSSGWFGLFFASLLVTFAVFALARFVGELLWLYPDELGWGRVDEAWMDVGDPDAPALEPEAREASPGPVALNSSVAGQVKAALDARDVALIVDLFVKHNAEAQSLPASLLLRVGQAAASASEYATAMDALMAAGRGDGDDSARALVIAGRILDERLRDHAGAKRVYEQVIARFDGTPAARWVREQLADPRFFLAR